MFAQELHIENACQDCPMRDLINCDEARLVLGGVGLNIRGQTFVRSQYTDAVGRRVEVQAMGTAVKASPLSNDYYADSSMHAGLVQQTVSGIRQCSEPKREGLLRQNHCQAGVEFRPIPPKEIAEIKRTMRPGFGSGFIAGARSKFRTS